MSLSVEGEGNKGFNLKANEKCLEGGSDGVQDGKEENVSLLLRHESKTRLRLHKLRESRTQVLEYKQM